MREVLYSDSMAAPLPYLSTILDAARESGRSEREISRAATGQPAALSLIKTGRVPSVERVRLLCDALDLEFYIGPPRDLSSCTPREATLPSGSGRGSPADARPPWADLLREAIREDLAKLLSNSEWRRPAGGSGEGACTPHGAPVTQHVEIRELSAAVDGNVTAGEVETPVRIAFPRGWLDRHGIDPARCAVLAVQGESMEPTVSDGASILIDCTRCRPRDGRVLVVHTRDGLVVRRARKDDRGRWRLASDHPAWPDTAWPDDAEVIGEVRWVATLLA